jgi:hypothetical protein
MNMNAALPREAWIDAFVTYVVGLEPGVSVTQITTDAERLYAHLGEYGPIEVAEAEWDELALPGRALGGSFKNG